MLAEGEAEPMGLPTKEEINPAGDCYDGHYAVLHFLGKTRAQITSEWGEHRHIYEEDLGAMGDKAFCFYLPAAMDHVTGTAVRDADAVSDLCQVIENRMQYRLPGLRPALPDVQRFAELVLAHSGEYEGLDDTACADWRSRLMAIQLRCAELLAASNSAPAAGQER